MAWQLKPFLSLERSCPIKSMAPVLAIVWMVAGIVLKRMMARPAGETEQVSPTGPGHVEFNGERLAMKPTPEEKTKKPPAIRSSPIGTR